MKIISEITGQEYKSIQECEQAEKAFAVKKEKERIQKELEDSKNRIATLSAQKKELSDKVEQANNKLDAAYDKYADAKKKAKEIVDKANLEAKNILEPIEKEIREAKKEKFNALVDFNKQFGSYNVKYTGEMAEKEYKRFIKEREDIWNNFFGKSFFDDFFKLW